MKSPLPLTIAKDTIVSQVAAFLYATRKVPESIEIIDITFHNINKDHVDLEVHLKQEKKEADIIYFDGPQLR